jgi:hypothetical protein
MKSHSSIVPAKPANKAERSAAESVEGDDGTKRNPELQSRDNMVSVVNPPLAPADDEARPVRKGRNRPVPLTDERKLRVGPV